MRQYMVMDVESRGDRLALEVASALVRVSAEEKMKYDTRVEAMERGEPDPGLDLDW